MKTKRRFAALAFACLLALGSASAQAHGSDKKTSCSVDSGYQLDLYRNAFVFTREDGKPGRMSLGGGKLFPAGGAQRWQVLTEQSLGDGIHDAALLARYEGAMRPEPLRWADWTTGQLDKIHCGLAAIDAKADSLGDRVDIGTITMGCVLGYLDLRFDHLGWRQQHAKAAAWFARFNARPAMQATLPKA